MKTRNPRALRAFERRLGRVSALGLVALALIGTASAQADPAHYNQPGNLLIADQFNNRVIEIDAAGHIIWQFGIGPNDVTATSVVGTNDAQRVGNSTLIAATGAPAGFEPACPSGCADNRVLLVSRHGHVLWQYGHFGVTGSGHDELNTPVQSTWTPDQTILITDQGNQRVIEVSLDKKILWQYGQTGVVGIGPNQLSNPNSAELLSNGHILIADENNNRAIEVDRKHNIIASFTAGGTVSGVAFASRLPNGHTLLTDSNNNRIVEVNAGDQVAWQYLTNTESGSNPAPLPTRAVRTQDGNTIISDQFNHRVIVVDKAGTLRSPEHGRFRHAKCQPGTQRTVRRQADR